MGKWEEFKLLVPPPPPHEHEKPVIDIGTVPEVGSVWRCDCGRTWKVYKWGALGRISISAALEVWKYMDETYYLLPFNYDQPTPRGYRGGYRGC